MSPRRARWSVLLAALACLVGTVSTAGPAAAYGATVHVTGHGWGHGRGLGQWGALGYALDQSQTYSQILDHYYGGTTSSKQGDSLMTVRLTEEDGVDMIVTSSQAFQIDDGTGGNVVNVGAGNAALVRHTAAGWDIFTATDCAGGTTKWGTAVASMASAATPRAGVGPTDDITKMINVCGPTGNVRAYRGTVTAEWSGTAAYVVNSLSTEQYLQGVVPRESPAYWGSAGGGKGLEALKAQAVAARSYAIAHNSASTYKICDTTACQVYGGAGLNGQVTEDSRANAAITATAGEVRVNGTGGVVSTEFSSSTGGYTAGGTFPAVPDDGDAVCDSSTLCNPNHSWSADIATTAIQAAYPTVGTLQAIQITGRNGLGLDGGRVTGMTIVGSAGKVTTTGASFQGKVGLKSDWFSVPDVAIAVSRISGPTRLATSIAMSKDMYADGTAKTVVVASAASYPDALVGAPLAYAKGGPILLTNGDALTTDTLGEINRATGSRGTVYLLGGTAVLSDNIAQQLTSAGYTVQRYAGANRFATAVEVAKALGDPVKILEATGNDFPDALAAGAAAAEAGGAVLLTNGSTQATETAAYLAGRTATKYAIGGAAAAADPSATAYAGSDRYDTAVKVALNFFAYPPSAGLASGETFADALGGAVHAVHMGGPLVLTATATLSPTTKAYLQSAANSSLTKVVIYGGTSAVSDQAAGAITTK